MTNSELTELLPFLTKQEREEIDRILEGRYTFREFVDGAWDVLEPGRAFIPNWHIDAICEHLVALRNWEFDGLIVNMPPRCMKSLLVSVLWPTWCWTEDPTIRFLFASYAENLAKRDALKSRRLIQSRWYQTHFGHTFKLTSDQNEKLRYENDRTGYRLSISVEGAGTGEGADIRGLDDPHKARDVHSDTKRENVVEWWRDTWSTRANDPKVPTEVIVMQRLHERDLSGQALADESGYVHLCLPMRFEEERACTFSIPVKSGDQILHEDPRNEEGELLWPDRLDERTVTRLEKRLGAYNKAGQFQQNPSPSEGGLFKKHHWRFWYPRGENPSPYRVRKADNEWVECFQREIPVKFDQQIQSWDMTFKDLNDSDYVVGQVWGKYLVDAFLLDEVRAQLGLSAACEAMLELSIEHPDTSAIYIEDKANGPASIDVLHDRIPGLIAVNPEGGKMARAVATQPYAESGNVFLPHPYLFPWVESFIEEMAKFPNGRFDDRVDAFSQALLKLLKGILGLDASEIEEANLSGRGRVQGSRGRGRRW